MKKDNTIKVAVIGGVAAVVAAYIGLFKKEKSEPPPPPPPVQYSGRVVDESTLRGISGAKVILDGNASGTLYSDSDGLFTVVLVPATQTIRVRVEVDGFQTLDRNVNVRQSGTEDLRLRPLGRTPSTPIPSTPTPSSPIPQGSPPAEAPEVRVWLNRPTGIYHCPGTHWYGRTNDGEFMTEAEALRHGYRPANYKRCTD